MIFSNLRSYFQASPLYWESEIDDEPLEETVKNGKVMQPMFVRTTAINRTNEPFQDLKITLEAVQEDSRGEFNVLGGAIMSTGLDKALTPVLESKSSIEFSHTMIPRFPGNFKIRFRAFVADKGSFWKGKIYENFIFRVFFKIFRFSKLLFLYKPFFNCPLELYFLLSIRSAYSKNSNILITRL